MSKTEKKVTIQTPPPPPGKKEEEEGVTKKEEEGVVTQKEEGEGAFFNIPVHIIPPGAKFRARGHKKKPETKLEPEKPKEDASVQPTPSPRQHGRTESVADDPSTSTHSEKEILPASNGFTIASCPCCEDRNQENLKQMAERGYRFAVPRRHPNPVDYSLPNPLSYRPTVTHLLLEIKRAPLRNSEEGLDEKNAAVMKCVTNADTRYEEAMKKLAMSVENFSVSENNTGASTKSEEKMNKQPLDSAKAEETNKPNV